MDQSHSLLDRTVANLRRMWREAAGMLPQRGAGRVGPDLDEADAELVRERMRACLEARGGEVSARARAADLGSIYLALSPVGRRRFLEILARDFDVDRDALRQTAARYVESSDPEDAVKLEGKLRAALTAPRRRLLTQFNALAQGVKFLVDLRAELLALSKGKLEGDLAGLDRDLRELLDSWFDVGFLDLRRITWRSPAALLEKLIAYEAVHRIRSWTDLRNRLDADRRCYGFFHPRMPDEPLIFVQVALVRGLAARIQPLLDEQQPLGDPQAADTAIFYSITNAQEGLRGIGFGAFLLKQVVDDLARELPHLKTFATLSPIPGFRTWLKSLLPEAVTTMVGPRDAALLAELAEPGGADWRNLLNDQSWPESPAIAETLQEPLMRLCAHYLLEAKRGSEPLDPVARFHLNNGAAIERLNWLGDVSPKGLAESAGLMVNYRYRLDDIEANHEAYSTHGTIAAADVVRDLAGSVGLSWRIPLLDRMFD